MKLLMVTREAEADKRYGLGRSLQPLVQELQGLGHEVHYLSGAARSQRSQRFFKRMWTWLLPVARRIAGKNSDADAVFWALLERFDMGRLAAKVARRDGFTHVHLHDPWIAFGFSVCGGRALRWGITEHGFGSYSHAVHDDGGRQSTRLAHWLRRLERRLTLTAHWVIAPTRAALAQLARDLAVHPLPDTWHAIPHPRPSPRVVPRREARAELRWPDEVLHVLAVGRLAPLKRFDLLVSALARVRAVRPVQLVILGEGDTEWLQQHALRCGMARPILFGLTDDIGIYLSAADLYVSTSATESFGMANLEAVAAGTRSICTAVGGVPEVVGHAATLVPVDEEAVRSALQAALDDRDGNAAWRARGIEHMARWPSAAAVATQYLAAYGVAPNATSRPSILNASAAASERGSPSSSAR